MTLSALPRWRHPLAYLLTAVAFLALDGVWLTLTTTPIYRPAIGHLMAVDVIWWAAALFYVGYFAGLVFFAVDPALTSRRPVEALARGAALGLLAYGAYDFTNQATLRDWPWHLTWIDLCWGGVNSGLSSFAAAAITSRLTSRISARSHPH
jgi:uncharacterized membrane protein